MDTENTESNETHPPRIGRVGKVVLGLTALAAIVFLFVDGYQAKKNWQKYVELATAQAGKISALEAEKAGLTNRVTLTNTVTMTATNVITTTNTTAVTATNWVTITNTVAVTQTNTVTATVTNLVTITNAVSATPATTTCTNAAPNATGANPIVGVVATATNSVVFYQDGSVTTTNALVGMVGGLPVLVDNVSSKTVKLTIKRLAGRGSITFEVANNTSPTVMLLQGQYNCSWRIKDRGEVAGSCTMTIPDGEPADLVVGKGVFSNTLTLVNQ